MISRLLILFLLAGTAGANTLNFSGRLLDSSGNPPEGSSRDLRFIVRDAGTEVCTRTITSVALTNGLFSRGVDFTGLCTGSIELQDHLISAINGGRTVTIQVEDVTSTPVAYNAQGLGTVPYSLASSLAAGVEDGNATAQALNITLADCDDGEAILYDSGGGFRCVTPAVGAPGSLNNLVTTEKIIDGSIATDDLANNAVTTDKIATGAIQVSAVSGLNGCTTDGQAVVIQGAGLSCGGGNLGDITRVDAGTGLTGGGVTGNVSFAINTAITQQRGTTTSCSAGEIITGIDVAGDVTCAAYTDLSGGTVTGPVRVPGAPTLANHAATKGYVDAHIATDSQISALTATKLTGTISDARFPTGSTILTSNNLNFTGSLQQGGSPVLDSSQLGTGANQILQLNGSGALPAFDGSLLYNLNPAQLTITVEQIPETTDAGSCADFLSDRTIASADNRKIFFVQAGATVTLPAAGSVTPGTAVTLKKVASADLSSPNANCVQTRNVDIRITGGENVDGQVMAQLQTTYSFITVVADSSRNQWVVINQSPFGAVVGVNRDCPAVILPSPFDSAAPTGTTLSNVLGGDTAPSSSEHGSVAGILRYRYDRLYGNDTCANQVETRVSACADGTWTPFSGDRTQRECEDQHTCYFPDGTSLAHNATRTVYTNTLPFVDIDAADSCAAHQLDVICKNGMIHDYTGATVGAAVLVDDGDIATNPSVGNTSTLEAAYSTLALTCTERQGNYWYSAASCSGVNCCPGVRTASAYRERTCDNGSCPAHTFGQATCQETQVGVGYSIALSNCGAAIACPAAPDTNLVYNYGAAGTPTLFSGELSCVGSHTCTCDNPHGAPTAHNAILYTYNSATATQPANNCSDGANVVASTCDGDTEAGSTGFGTYSAAPTGNATCVDTRTFNWYTTAGCVGADCCNVTNATTVDTRTCDTTNTCGAYDSAGNTSCVETINRNWYTPDAGPVAQTCSGSGCCAGFLNTSDTRTCTTGSCGAWDSTGTNGAAGFTTCTENLTGWFYNTAACNIANTGGGSASTCCELGGNSNSGAGHSVICTAGSCVNPYPQATCTETRQNTWYTLSSSPNCLAGANANTGTLCNNSGCATPSNPNPECTQTLSGFHYTNGSCAINTTCCLPSTNNPTATFGSAGTSTPNYETSCQESRTAYSSAGPVASCTTTGPQTRTYTTADNSPAWTAGGFTTCLQNTAGTETYYSTTSCSGSGCCLTNSAPGVITCTGGSCSGPVAAPAGFPNTSCVETRPNTVYSVAAASCPGTPCPGGPNAPTNWTFDNNGSGTQTTFGPTSCIGSTSCTCTNPPTCDDVPGCTNPVACGCLGGGNQCVTSGAACTGLGGCVI